MRRRVNVKHVRIAASLTRVISVIRTALARRFLIKIKRATHRSPANLINPSAKNVVVIAPHMDDEVIGCGGTLLRLADEGAAVRVVYVSDSSGPNCDSELADRRHTEAEKVRKEMGFAGVTRLNYADGRLHHHEDAIAKDLARELAGLSPDLILCPFPSDAHSDHMACAAAVARALRNVSVGTVLAYEIWTPLWPNVAIDITSVAERKASAIRLYASQIADRDYAAATLGLNRYRGLPHSVEYAEAFFQCSGSAYVRLAGFLNRL